MVKSNIQAEYLRQDMPRNGAMSPMTIVNKRAERKEITMDILGINKMKQAVTGAADNLNKAATVATEEIRKANETLASQASAANATLAQNAAQANATLAKANETLSKAAEDVRKKTKIVCVCEGVKTVCAVAAVALLGWIACKK